MPACLRRRLRASEAAWSYELLTPPQRTLLAWLTAFRGSFTAESAEELVRHLSAGTKVPVPNSGEPLMEFDALDALTALVDHSLLRRAANEPAPRFGMYETIREFGEEQLSGKENLPLLRHAHAQWCLETLTKGEPAVTGSDPAATLAAWDCELPDFRAALAWWRGAGNRPDDALRIIGELWYYWVLRGQASEGIDEAAAAVEHPGVTPETPEFSRALHALGTLCFLRDRPKEARAALERALEIRRRHESEDAVYATLGNLASVKRSTNDLAGALKDLQEVLEYLRRTGNSRRIGVTLSNMSLALQFMGRLEDSRAAIHESIEIYSSLNDRRGVARQQLNLGRLEHSRGRFAEALQAFEAALATSRELGDTPGNLNARLAIANTLTAVERYDEARQQFAECEVDMSADDSASRLASFYIARGYLEWRTGALDRALADYRLCLRLRLDHEDLSGLGDLLVQLGQVFAAQGRTMDAARLLGIEARLQQEVGYKHSDDNLRELRETRQAIVAALAEESTRTLEEEGRNWTLERLAAVVCNPPEAACDNTPS